MAGNTAQAGYLVKLVLLLVIGVLVAVVVVPVAAVMFVIGTNPWLGSAELQGRPLGLDPIVVTTNPGDNSLGISLNGQMVPTDQWPVMQAVAASSSCGIDPLDLAAIGKVESEWGTNMVQPGGVHFGYGQFDTPTWHTYGSGNPNVYSDALPAIARILCARGYAANRSAALNSYGGCVTANCLGNQTYTWAIDTTRQRITTVDLVAHNDVVATARQFLNVPYQWGGTTSAGLDCSGLVLLTYQKLGIATINGRPFPRTSELQYPATQRVSQAQPGDLVFFSNTDGPGITHVGIVVDPVAGTMINAPTPGTRVRIESYNSGFFGSHFAGFGRVTP